METNKISSWTKHWLEKRNIPHSFFKVTNSTNDLAKQKKIKKPFKNHVFLTNKQIKGRGQGNNQWEDSDLMITWLWDNISIPLHTKLSEEFMSGLLKSVKKVWPSLPWRLKNPNDLYLENKKIAGLLIEVIDQSLKKNFIAGLGFNVFSHPKQNTLQAGHLKEYIDISQKEWEVFLDELHKQWTQKITH